ncbi:molybdopterin binding oxidoreductase [Viridothelium virens]|uniref:Nitrate reductase [NADPH] n=1 Tax=Viridothelium virens TaxID=1048519 RepID=A0A6A6HH49_VIRVR|nr:molybdopterin binding oxidoreductase [Viridothelium virens]
MRWTPVSGSPQLQLQRHLTRQSSSRGMLAARFARPKTHNNARMLHFQGPSWSGTTFNPNLGRKTTPRSRAWAFPVAASALAIFSFGLTTYATSQSLHAEAPPEESLPKIRFAEVREHGIGAKSIWVTRGTKVYDITDWIEAHPGGEVILRAAGGSIDPYWKLFTIHQKQDVYDILESYLIGVIDPQDLVNGQLPTDDIDDPFQTDPKRDTRLLVHSNRPCNAETPGPQLSAFITPNPLFYVRNHLWVPQVAEPEEHKLTIELVDGTEKIYTLRDLRAKFPECKIHATLQCSGNRRSHMSATKHATGLQWDVGAIGTAEWSGVLLRDVLADAGVNVNPHPSIDPEEKTGDVVRHAQFIGAETYGASIPISKALASDGDVLLAYSMNGEPLPRDHGYPLRVIVPGTVAARSVKWLSRVVLSPEESPSQWQRRDYKCFGPNVQAAGVNWDRGKSIQEMPVQSAITSLQEISGHVPEYISGRGRIYWLDDDHIALEGYAFSGGGREIVRVDISTDGGRTWQQAELLGESDGSGRDGKGDAARKGSKCWAWKRWKCDIPKMDAAIGGEFVVKATDESYNTQPESYMATWNFRGNLTSAWQRVPYAPTKEIRGLVP